MISGTPSDCIQMQVAVMTFYFKMMNNSGIGDWRSRG